LEEMLDKPTDMVSFGAGDYFLDSAPDLVNRFRRNAVKQYKNVKIIRASKYRDRHMNETNQKYKTHYFRLLEELKIDIQIVEDKISISSIEKE